MNTDPPDSILVDLSMLDDQPASLRVLLTRTFGIRPADIEESDFGNIHLAFASGKMTRGSRAIWLPAKELQLLRYLISWRGTILSREELLDVHIAALRQTLEQDPRAPRHILTVRRHGYTFRE